MRRIFGRSAVLVSVVSASVVRASGPAGAAPSPEDVETDHVDAVDDGGPRLVRVLVQPFSPAIGMAAAEVSAAVAERVALSAALGWLDAPAGSGCRISVGLPAFPNAAAFHGLYLHPRVEWTRVGGATTFGAGATVGFAWTWPFGATVVAGAGLAYEGAPAGHAADLGSWGGFAPRIDSSVGWLF